MSGTEPSTTPLPLPPGQPEDGPRWCVAHFGGHPVGVLGIDLAGGDEELRRWLLASALPLEPASGPDGPALAAFEALERGGLLAPPPVPDERGFLPSQALAIEAVLARAGLRRADETALLIARLAHAVAHRLEGSLERAAARCDELDSLGRRLTGLAPGFGRTRVLRFLQPLRDRWSAAADLPLDPRAHAAGADLGWWDETSDPEGAAARLRSLCDGDVPLRDAEAALARLGAASCVRGRAGRCPLGRHCPRREAER